MSIVLPRRKKRVDIFAPSKAIQRAKETLGPGYFDATLLECSHNAVELTKLVSKWDDIDKKKLKRIRELCREQERMIRSLKSHANRVNDDDPIASIEGVETVEGKMVPPGFRFRSNGELKTSTTGLPTVNLELDDEGNVTTRKESRLDGLNLQKSSKEKDETDQSYAKVDYDKEIRELENVLYDIYKGLLKNRIELFNTSGGSIRTYLRGHKNEYIPPPDTTDYLEYEKPNDRFAFKPGSSYSENLYKKKISNPSHRSCIGCQFRLKAASDTVAVRASERGKEEVGRRRWNYVPQGKYVESTTAFSVTSLLSKPSKANVGSNVHFHEVDQTLRGAKSEKVFRGPNKKLSGVSLRATVSSPEYTARTWRSKSAVTEKELDFKHTSRSPDSSLGAGLSSTTVSGRGSALWRSFSASLPRTDNGPFSSHMVDQKLRLKTLKLLQV